MIPINIIFDNYIPNASQLKDDHDLTDFLLIGMYQIALHAKEEQCIIATHGIRSSSNLLELCIQT